ncbi:MAG: glycosyltransferase family protein [Desulfobacteraceae bacterium]|nr:glycosyltransferase family protein [Desulfobacteraceae bacterium]
MEKKKIIATVECRMTSSRLPGKVMLESYGKTMLEHIAERLSRVNRIEQIIFATTTNKTDDCIEELARKIRVGCFRGPEEDVLQRILSAARAHEADIIVEITGDCPLIDPDVAAQTIELYLQNACDYASNDLKPSFPLGMDVQVFATELLALADREGLTPDDREHVSWYIVRHPERFRLLHLPAPPPLYWPELRLTLDEGRDFILIDRVFQALYHQKPDFDLYDIIRFLKANIHLTGINADVIQKRPS